MDARAGVDSRPKARSDLHVEVVDGEAVVLDERSGNLHRCNDSATAVLRACDGTRTLDAIVRELAAELGLPRAAVAPDAHDALDQLRRAGLVE